MATLSPFSASLNGSHSYSVRMRTHEGFSSNDHAALSRMSRSYVECCAIALSPLADDLIPHSHNQSNHRGNRKRAEANPSPDMMSPLF